MKHCMDKEMQGDLTVVITSLNCSLAVSGVSLRLYFLVSIYLSLDSRTGSFGPYGHEVAICLTMMLYVHIMGIASACTGAF